MKLIYQCFFGTLLLAVLLCGIYPALVTITGKIFFHQKAEGSFLYNRSGEIVGSRLIGQNFSKPEYFHSRPSAAGDKGYDATSSSGSNLSLTNQKWADSVNQAVEALLKDNPSLKKGDIPPDIITASGSGLDPHISPAAALLQVDRIAQARNISSEELKKLVEKHIEGPQFGLLGEPVVNALLLNLELDRLYPPKS